MRQLGRLQSQSGARKSCSTSCIEQAPRPCHCVDHVSKPHRLNPKQGVGLARKIGCDLGLALISLGRIRSPWLLQSDADVVFPYTSVFSANTDGTPDKDSPGALIFPHTHHSDDPVLHRAASLYDLHMATTLQDFLWQAVPYAHHSLGSTIAVHADDIRRGSRLS